MYKVLYVIDDEFQYVFPNNSYFSCIIDFSRSIVNHKDFEKIVDYSLPSTYKLIDDEKKFKIEESNRLLNLYMRLFPNKLKQKEELVVLFKNHFEAVFKLLTCIDLYMFTIRLSRMLGQLDIPIHNRAVSLVDKINKLSEIFITNDMNYLMDNMEMYSNKIIESDWPILSIIKKCFFEYNGGTCYKNIGIINDMYMYNNSIKFHIDEYDKFPDIIKYAKYYDNGKLKNIKLFNDFRKDNRMEYEAQKKKNLEMINYIAMRHSQKLL